MLCTTFRAHWHVCITFERKSCVQETPLYSVFCALSHFWYPSGGARTIVYSVFFCTFPKQFRQCNL